MRVRTIARLVLKVKVIGQGQRLVSSAYGHGNAVTRSVASTHQAPPTIRCVFREQPMSAFFTVVGCL